MQETVTIKPKALRPNGLSEMVDVLTGAPGTIYGAPQTIAQPWTLIQGNAYSPFTLNRIGLSYSFMSQGLVQTIITQPVSDAFRGGFSISSSELDEQDLRKLLTAIKRPRGRNKFVQPITPNAGYNIGNSDIHTAQNAMNWSRLYGGAGLIINTDQPFSRNLETEKIRQDSPLEFIAADRWELILSQTDVWSDQNQTPFNYYGLPLHRSRVVKIMGIEAPSYIRLRLQGWGLSALEACIRAINSFVKFENLIFELIDEAKIDVFQIEGFNDSLLTDEGSSNTARRVALANQLKNFQSALVMDKNDEYSQKQITWSGLAELWNELRLNLSSALKIPMNKLFGQSATGFGGGQDSLENYNSIVEQVRYEAEPVVTTIVDLRCQQLFGFIPDYEIAWRPLKILDAKEEEEVKTSKQNRALQLFMQRLITGIETSRILKTEGLLGLETEVSQGLRDVEPVQPGGDELSGQSKADAEKS
jgi:phage-related protein (TIGR01555 family)